MAETEPKLPRRVFVASALAAIVAGGSTALVSMGGITQPTRETFRFARGTSLAPGEEERLRGFLAAALADDRVEVRIVGHTGTQGNEAANLALSQERAAAVRALAEQMGVANASISATGVGGGAPMAKSPDQSERAYEASLSRVDVTLQVRR